MKNSTERTKIFLEVFPMGTAKEAPRTIQAMFEKMDNYQGSPEGLKRALMNIARKEGGQSLTEAWAIAEAFLDLITDTQYLNLINS